MQLYAAGVNTEHDWLARMRASDARKRPRAAVLHHHEAGADALHVIPEGAKLRKVGTVVLGYDHDPCAGRRHSRRRIKRRFGSRWSAMAARRLSGIDRLVLWRLRCGIWHPRRADWLLVIANALWVRDGECTPNAVLRHVCPLDLDRITPAMIEAAIQAAPRDRLIDDHEAGRLAHLELWELMLIQEHDDLVLTMSPIDEDDAARLARRRARERQKGANRQDRCRSAKRNVATTVTVPIDNRKRDTRVATLQADRIVAAIRDGARTPQEIIAATGLPSQTVRSWLTRLVRSGDVERVARGHYAVADRDGGRREAPARGDDCSPLDAKDQHDEQGEPLAHAEADAVEPTADRPPNPMQATPSEIAGAIRIAVMPGRPLIRVKARLDPWRPDDRANHVNASRPAARPWHIALMADHAPSCRRRTHLWPGWRLADRRGAGRGARRSCRDDAVRMFACTKCGNAAVSGKRGPISTVCGDCRTRCCRRCRTPLTVKSKHVCSACSTILARAKYDRRVERALALVITGSRRCGSCGNEKPVSEFHRHRGHTTGLVAVCKSCTSQKRYPPKARSLLAADARARCAQPRAP